MPNFSEPTVMSFIIETVFAIFVVVGLGVWGVLRAKRKMELEELENTESK
ncbi:MAG: hypothetical protein GQ570_12670 [Helicobacteraceae bacterium]|nr:hypothetical protein [Helicobacteraceae bacterium]